MARRWDVWACDVDGATVIFLVRMAPASASDGCLLEHKYEVDAGASVIGVVILHHPPPAWGGHRHGYIFPGGPKRSLVPKDSRSGE